VSGGWTPRRNWQAINAASVAKECSEAHVAFLIADAKGDIADLTTSQAGLVEALRATLNALEKLDAGETKIATRARALLAKIDGETA
jgi:hypothetical protein